MSVKEGKQRRSPADYNPWMALARGIYGLINKLPPNYFQVQGEEKKNPVLLVWLDDAILDNEQ